MKSLEEKHAEAKLALYVACHTFINAVDHLNEVQSSIPWEFSNTKFLCYFIVSAPIF